jgi:hypothetical protein
MAENENLVFLFYLYYVLPIVYIAMLIIENCRPLIREECEVASLLYQNAVKITS